MAFLSYLEGHEISRLTKPLINEDEAGGQKDSLRERRGMRGHGEGRVSSRAWEK